MVFRSEERSPAPLSKHFLARSPDLAVDRCCRDSPYRTSGGRPRRHFSAEDKIRIALEGLRGEDSIAELGRKEGIAQDLRREARALKECVADPTLENRLLKKA